MIDQLHTARELARVRCKQIGEPLVVLPTEYLFVHELPDGKKRVSIRADHFIEVAESFASVQLRPPSPPSQQGRCAAVARLLSKFSQQEKSR